MHRVLPLFSAFLFVVSSEAKTKIKCHECWSPFGAFDLPPECSEEKFCMGFWCTKGPDERANGVYHGCSDVAPVDERRPQCKDVVYREVRKGHTNCYCNNVEFCNSASFATTGEGPDKRPVRSGAVAMAGISVLSAFVAVPFLYFCRFLSEQIPYSEQGFFCDDDEIRNPDRPSTVPSNVMYLAYAAIALITIPIAEFSLVIFLSQKGKRVAMIAQSGFHLHPWLFNVAFFILALLCGDLCASIAANVGKRTISRLRPNFLSVCQPDLATLCPASQPNRYVFDYTCLGETNPDLHYSFPSGHATHSAFFAVFMILYLNKRLRIVDPVRPFLQFAIFLLAFYVTLSRVRDFKHRLADVLGGAILGGSIGCVMVHLMMKNFRPYRYHVVDAAVGYDEIGEAPSPPPTYPDVVVDKPRVYGTVAA